MCNLYTSTTSQDAMRQLFKGLKVALGIGNLAPGKIWPDQLAPIIRHGEEGLELVKARWGMPSPPSVLNTARDPGVTNIRNLSSPHWRRWLGPAHRCLVPVSAFAEPEPIKGGNQWFGPANPEHPMFFAGLEVRNWTSLRKIKTGETTDDLYGFLTCAPNALVQPIHPKAMPVILTQPDEWQAWLNGPISVVHELQRPLADEDLVLIEDPEDDQLPPAQGQLSF